MGKWTDKLYITHGEWATQFGGAKNHKNDKITPFFLPFGSCNISFAQLIGKDALSNVEPVLDVETGLMYDRKAILQSGLFPSISDEEFNDRFIPFKWESDQTTKEPICPVSRKTLNDNLPIVMIKTTGWLYDAETVQNLNILRKNMTDLMTGMPFTRPDIIKVRNKINPQQISSLTQEGENTKERKRKAAGGYSSSIQRIIENIESKPSALVAECKRLGLEKTVLRHVPTSTIISCPGVSPMPPKHIYSPPQSSKPTKGQVSASFMSTAMGIKTRNELL